MPPTYPTLTQSAQIEQSSLGVALIPWDPDRGWASDRSPTDTFDNQGCPPGYGTIYQSDAFGNLVKSCRLVATATEAQIRQDAAPGLVDQSIINIAAAAESVVEGAKQVGETAWDIFQRMLTTLGPWLAVAGIGYLLIVAPRPRSNPGRRGRRASESLLGKTERYDTIRRYLGKLGITIRKVPSTGEYRVNYRGGKESTAYYTDDLGDAFDTGKDMALRGTPGVSYD